MTLPYPESMAQRRTEWAHLTEFVCSGEPHPALGIVWGRRRVGKTYLLRSLVDRAGGFYFSAVRSSAGEALRELGAEIAAFRGDPAPLTLDSWDAAVGALLSLGEEEECPVILDEYPYLLEHSPELDSVIQRALGARTGEGDSNRTRLILCGSAVSVMKELLGGSAPLRGRAGLDLPVHPFHYRAARHFHGIEDRATALRTFAVIGGVAAYGREMVSGDLPTGPSDWTRWLCRRVLTPSSPLFDEVPFLLSEDPVTSKARKPNLYHATLSGIALGNTTHGDLTGYVGIPGASLVPIVEALTAARLVERIHDPIRDNRPTYHPADPLVRFHYALMRKHRARLARHDVNTRAIWDGLRPTFRSQILGPVFESIARYWALHFGAPEIAGAAPVVVGPTVLSLGGGAERQIDVLVAAADADRPSERTVLALGEAKSGEELTGRHLARLEECRSALGLRAGDARLLLFGTRASSDVRQQARDRGDVELIDLERLYGP